MVDAGMKTKTRPRIVGKFIRERRQAISLSQRALGQLFTPPVTTQFISNVERGVTPLPPTHVPTLCQALRISEQELLDVMEREYTSKLSGKLGFEAPAGRISLEGKLQLPVSPEDFDIMEKLYKAYQSAGLHEKSAFTEFCDKILREQT